jgi:glycine cleavage system H lipoate-binding protein
MTIALDVLQMLGSFLVGLAGRAGLFIVAGIALATPALVIALGWRFIAGRSREPGSSDDLRIAPNHTWMAPRGESVAVGVDEIAQRILPSATALELPRAGMEVHRGDPIAVVRAGRRAIRIGAPVDGTIVAVNGRARRNPCIVKEDPYGAGWLFLIAPRDDAWRKLPGGERARAWLAAERRRLALCVEEQLGIAAADGGELVEPAPALLGEEGWRKVVAAFLHAA